MRNRAADDADFIFGRIADLRKEEAAQRNAGCDCPDDVREDGTTVKMHRQDCSHYSPPAPICYVAPMQQPRRLPDDDWATLKEQMRAVEAAFLLHSIRITKLTPALLRVLWA